MRRCIILLIMCLCLPLSAAIEDLENDYTEVDPDSASHFPDAYEIRFWTNANTDTGLYKTFGSDYFSTTFEHTFQTEGVYNSSSTSPELIVWGLSDGGYTENDLNTANHGITIQWDCSSATDWFFVITDWADDTTDSSIALAEDTEYWLKVVGNGTTIVVTIFASEANRTAGTPVVDTLTITLNDGADKYSTFIAQGYEDESANNTIVAVSGYFDLGDVPAAGPTGAQIF